MHLDVKEKVAALHLGPLLTDADRRYLSCDATCEVWFERDGQVIGAGRATRLINRRLRRALEHRHPTCAVPGCGATRGLHAHHIRHWEDGGLTELFNLVLVCPYHHRLHHRGVITITGPADNLIVTDSAGRRLSPGSLARPPTNPRPRSHRAPGPPASAPTGGGTNPSNLNHHRPTTRLVTAAGHYRHYVTQKACKRRALCGIDEMSWSRITARQHARRPPRLSLRRHQRPQLHVGVVPLEALQSPPGGEQHEHDSVGAGQDFR